MTETLSTGGFPSSHKSVLVRDNEGQNCKHRSKQTHCEIHFEFMAFGEVDPQLNERLCVWQKVRGLEGETETKYRRHTDPNGGYDQNEIKRNKALCYFKQNCPIFRFAIQTFLRG